MNRTKIAPGAILNGVEDNSTRTIPPTLASLPIHHPFYPIFGERGDVDVVKYGSIDDIKALLGAKTFDSNAPYLKHHTAHMAVVGQTGNKVAAMRLKPEGAKRATLRLTVEYVDSKVDNYERDPETNKYVVDIDGNKKPTGSKANGIKVRWKTSVITDDFGSAPNADGTAWGEDSANSSKILPILDLELPYGAYGNNVGVRLMAPLAGDELGDSTDIGEELNEFMYRIAFDETLVPGASPSRTLTNFGERFVDFALGEKAHSSTFKVDYALEQRLKQYDIKKTQTAPAKGSPFNRVHVYHNNVKMVQEEIFALESDTFPYDKASEVNIFTLVSEKGVPYYNCLLADDANRGVMLTSSTRHVFQGGNDGDISDAAYDKAVEKFYKEFESHPQNFLDRARIPFTAIWDSGFSLKTKDAMKSVIGKRKNVVYIESTHIDLVNRDDPDNPNRKRGMNTASEDSALAISLRAGSLAYPESPLFSTPTIRAAVVSRSGYLKDRSVYPGIVPFTFEVAYKVAKYAGAANGQLTDGKSFDRYPGSRVDIMEELSAVYTPDPQKNQDWQNSLIYPQSYGTDEDFIPHFSTVYPDKTSIFTSLLSAFVVADLENVCDSIWRDMNGSDDDEQDFIDESDAKVIERTKGRYNGRFAIRPETFFTEADRAGGTSSSCKIHMSGNKNRYVGSFTIVGDRKEG